MNRQVDLRMFVTTVARTDNSVNPEPDIETSAVCIPAQCLWGDIAGKSESYL
jgi:hypothetical protein